MAGDISLADTNTAGVVIFGLIMGASHFGSRRCTRAIDTDATSQILPSPDLGHTRIVVTSRALDIV